MERLFFLSSWGKAKEKAWSGTNWSVCQALSRHYRIEEIDVKRPFLRRVVNKFCPALHDMELGSLLRNRKRLQGRIREGAVFQFQELCVDSDKRRTYIYKDLSVSYLAYLAKADPALFAYSGFAHIPLRSIERKARMEREYHCGCSSIFTMSRWLRDFLVEHDGIPTEKVHHVGGGINVDAGQFDGSMRRGNKILFIGRDFERKGGDLVCEAFRCLRAEMPEAELHVAGPAVNPCPGGMPGYHYYGDIPFERLPELFNRCDAFCMPTHFEAYGLVFPEALCYGLPCIGRAVHEMPWFIEQGETGLLLEHDDAGELAQKMKAVLRNPAYGENVRARRGTYLEKYSWVSVARRISEVIG